VQPYCPGKKIKWDVKSSKAFETIKDAINNCPTLSFMDDHAPVFLHTDASDYGIGAYLCHMDDYFSAMSAFSVFPQVDTLPDPKS
jgi:hypothetical protein